MTIYLDVILLENLCMNYIILFATGIIQKFNLKQWRLLCSSILGAIYSIFTFIPLSELYTNVILKIILSIAMVYIAFPLKNIKSLFRSIILFYLVSFAFGGCAFFLLYFIKPQDILIRNGVLTGTYPIKIAILGGILGFVIVNIAFKVIKGKISKKDMYCYIHIGLKEKETVIKVLIDTGNLLKDPISGMPVIVVEAKELHDIISDKILDNVSKILLGNTSILEEMASDDIPKFRIIPFSSLGKQNGLLLGFIADYIVIETEEMKRKVDKVIIGMYDKALTKNGAYMGLIGLDILERCDKNEYFTNVKEPY